MPLLSETLSLSRMQQRLKRKPKFAFVNIVHEQKIYNIGFFKAIIKRFIAAVSALLITLDVFLAR